MYATVRLGVEKHDGVIYVPAAALLMEKAGASVFKLVEGKGFRGNYTNAFGTLDDMLAARHTLVAQAAAAGVAT